MRFGALLPKKRTKLPPPQASPERVDPNEVSPELLPIVTLLSAQQHRRYHEGIFMLYNDLNGDGKPADRQWQEVYGILTGNQLAYWDARNLAKFKDLPEKLLETSNKPNYLNFTDAVFNAMAVLPAAKQQLENVIIVLTTLKNRYILQLRSYDQLKEWYLSLRLAMFEYQLLQEAYTGALLSARGLRLLDIKTILAEKRFNHEDWVKIRYGSGMAWRRCYAVIEPSMTRRKLFVPGRMLLYESDNVKKKNLIGVINDATLVTAVYPQLPFFIDKSTIMKLEGSINFKLPSVKNTKKNSADILETSLFIMPEQHSAVPGFDTLIRFLIPLFDSFGLYGRPKRLKADRVDPDSLLFGLPTLPHVHYLNVNDLSGLVELLLYLTWDVSQWRDGLKSILRLKLALGYEGCGSARGFLGAINSLNSPRGEVSLSLRNPSATQNRQDMRVMSSTLPKLAEPLQPSPAIRVALASVIPRDVGERPQGALGPASDQMPYGQLRDDRVPERTNRNVKNLEVRTEGDGRKSVQLADIYHKYSKIQTPSDRFDDRNKILNGSAEEIDEEVLPSLIRKKSLMHGGIYPSSETHLIESSDSEDDDEADEDDEENGSSDSVYRAEGPLNTGPLKVPVYDQRNSSYSSVQSPLTQYSEFNKQFLKAVEQPGRPDLHSTMSDDYESDSGYSESQSPPPIPAHACAAEPRPEQQTQPVQRPQIQKLNSDLGPNSYPQGRQNSQTQDQMYQTNPDQIQKSRANIDLNLSLNGAEGLKPRYIMSPNNSQNQLPRFNEPPQQLHSQPQAYPQGLYPGQGAQGSQGGQSSSHPPHGQPHRKAPPQVTENGAQHAQHVQHAHPQAAQHAQHVQQSYPQQQEPQPQMYQGQGSGAPTLRTTSSEYEQSSPTVAPTSAFRVQPQQPPPGQYRQAQGRPQQMPPPQQQQYQGQQRHPYHQRVEPRPPQGYASSKYGPQQGYPNQRQYGPGSQQPQQPQQQYQQQPQQQNHAMQQQQGMQQVPSMPMHQYNMPQRPVMQQQQSALSLRSYDDSGQMYQFQVQPNLRQPPNQQQQDPRYQPNPNQTYMRKY